MLPLWMLYIQGFKSGMKSASYDLAGHVINLNGTSGIASAEPELQPMGERLEEG